MEKRNAKYNANGTIDVEIKHPIHGWIPFTASLDDPSKFGRLLYGEIKGKAAAHVPVATSQHVPQPNPDINAAIQALIDGDTVAAQAAMDEET